MARTLPALLLVLAACGGSDGPQAPASRTVEVTMRSVAFEPATLSVRAGETVTFRFTNADAIPHDVFVGTAAEQAEHEKDMRAGGHAHGDGAVDVAAGGTATLTHTFGEAGTVEIGCHEPGHYAAGMKIVVTVN